jgi:hypothetical protein
MLQSSVKNMHYSINPEEIKTETEKHTVTNIWNIKECRTKLSLSMFIVELKCAPNNKDIFNVQYIQQCKITFEPSRHKCAYCQRYGHTKIITTSNQDESNEHWNVGEGECI